MFRQELYTQYFILIKSLGIGIINGLIYSLLALFGNGKRLFRAVLDFLFCFVFAITSFVFVFDINFGVPRAYIFVGEAVGFLSFVTAFKKSKNAKK